MCANLDNICSLICLYLICLKIPISFGFSHTVSPPPLSQLPTYIHCVNGPYGSTVKRINWVKGGTYYKSKILIYSFFSFLSANSFVLIHVSTTHVQKRIQKLVYLNNIYFAWFYCKLCSQNNWRLYFEVTEYQWCKKMQGRYKIRVISAW